MHNTFGNVHLNKATNEQSLQDISCTNGACILTFSSYEKLERHLNYSQINMRSRNKHSYPKLLINGWQDFKKEIHPRLIQVWEVKGNHQSSWKKVGQFLKELQDTTSAQKSVLNKIYDRGEESGSKVSAESREGVEQSFNNSRISSSLNNQISFFLKNCTEEDRKDQPWKFQVRREGVNRLWFRYWLRLF